jgi:hypothetical protein
MTLPDFVPFQSIPRLSRRVVITEKLDGTNGCVWISEDLSTVHAGSRNRWITKQEDNYGFAKWVEEHADELKGLGAGFHYGEWWGQGIQRRYDLTEKRWSLFNVSRWGLTRPACCHVVPALYDGDFKTDAVDNALQELSVDGSRAAPGFANPEGVVVWHENSNHLYKKTIGDDGHKKQRGVG